MASIPLTIHRRLLKLACTALAVLLTACHTGAPRETPATERPAASGQAGTHTARATVDRFLQVYFTGYGSGLPTAAERATFEPLLTTAFLDALAAASAAEDCMKARHGGTEPPMVQGDLFSSLFEKATGVVGIEAVASEPRQASLDVHFEWREPEGRSPPVDWRDRFVLENVAGEWRIDDVIHGGQWQFTNPGSVRALLQRVAAQCGAGAK